MKRFIFVAVVSALQIAGLVTAQSTQAAARPDPHVYVIGDSITALMAKSDYRPKGWRMDGFPGRRITALAQPYSARTTDYWTAVSHIFAPRVSHRVNTVIIGLGTNGADVDLTVEQAAGLYREGIARIRQQDIWLPGAQRIVLVTPYRVPRIDAGHVSPATGQEYEPYQWASKMGVYAAAMREIATQDAHVCIMPWRAVVSKHPGLLVDGIHPNARGRKVWRTLAIKSVNRCN